jgi:hypothetical protein
MRTGVCTRGDIREGAVQDPTSPWLEDAVILGFTPFRSIYAAFRFLRGLEQEGSFFDGTRYTEKVRNQMRQDDFHGFPESVKTFESDVQVTTITGGDGGVRQQLTIPGSYKGRDGNFEFIKEPNGNINHRYFRPIGD